ncbi:WD40-repeat-containing domain [Pseudocohnilembus persalinus]|uniref:WD40-repeat-containing domain n=1 Tax=Pseudocohnilembus persalinus TaxID=266149 RepID=A0A0V0R0R0_PSEPJ|nr:WD40-repeat-containing domain [Pseudocohnilembus persalinus]|eukprot:KRX07949.1 WD40-repeat-containing domain [Pseudocohnilembus persalinus]
MIKDKFLLEKFNSEELKNFLNQENIFPYQNLMEHVYIKEEYVDGQQCSLLQNSNQLEELFVISEKFINNEENYQQSILVISGPSGSGKTAFLNYLQDKLEYPQNMYYISLQMFINHEQLKQYMRFIFENIYKNDKEKIVFLLDGYDDMVFSSSGKKISLFETFRLIFYKNSKLIVTTKSNYIQKSNLQQMSAKFVYITPLNRHQVRSMIRKYIKVQNRRQQMGFLTFKYYDEAQKYYDQFKQYQFYLKLVKIPINLKIMVEVLNEIQDKIKVNQKYNNKSRENGSHINSSTAKNSNKNNNYQNGTRRNSKNSLGLNSNNSNLIGSQNINSNNLLGAELLSSNIDHTILNQKTDMLNDLNLNQRVLNVNDTQLIDNIKNYYENAMEMNQLNILKEKLLAIICFSKEPKYGISVISANAATIYNSLNFSFSGLDLSFVNIKGAMLQSSIFHKTNLRFANLEEVDMKNAILQESNFEGAWLGKISLGNIPHLKRKNNPIRSALFSPLGTFIVYLEDKEKTFYMEYIQETRVTLKFTGHTKQVNCISYAPNGRQIASGSEDKLIKIWDSLTGELICDFNHNDIVNFCTFSADGKMVASASQEWVKIWSLETEKKITQFQAHDDWITCLQFSYDNQFLASSSWDNSVRIWDIQNGKMVNSYIEHQAVVTYIAFSPQYEQIASCSRDNNIKIWDYQQKKVFKTLRGHTDFVLMVNFSKQGKYLISCSMDETAKIWETETGENLQTLYGHSSFIYTVQFSQCGRYIMTGSYDKSIKIWDFNLEEEDGYQPDRKGHSKYVNYATISPDGEYIASCSNDKYIKIWTLETGQNISTLVGHQDWVNYVAFNKSGNILASSSWDKTVKIWNVENGVTIQTLQGVSNSVFKSVNFSNSGRFLIAGRENKSIKIWDTTNWKTVETIEGHKQSVNSVIFSSDDKLFISASKDKTIKIWDFKKSIKIKTLIGHDNSINFISVSNDGNLLASAGRDNLIILWNMKNFKIVDMLKGHKNYVTSVNFSDCNQYLVSSSRDKTLKIWDISVFQDKSFILQQEQENLQSSIDQQKVSYQSQNIQNNKGNQKILKNKNKDQNKIQMQFDDQEENEASDRDLLSRQLSYKQKSLCILTLKGCQYYVNSAEFSPDSNFIVSTSNDKSIKIWKVVWTGDKITDVLLHRNITEKQLFNFYKININLKELDNKISKYINKYIEDKY